MANPNKNNLSKGMKDSNGCLVVGLNYNVQL